mmetsp:Transcript_122626/g.318853  ORF Transcript_122626/g.318853 Transcript_122626/m.318853 type:complete len:223 (-) Transcript_122626:615-1283(-)
MVARKLRTSTTTALTSMQGPRRCFVAATAMVEQSRRLLRCWGWLGACQEGRAPYHVGWSPEAVGAAVARRVRALQKRSRVCVPCVDSLSEAVRIAVQALSGEYGRARNQMLLGRMATPFSDKAGTKRLRLPTARLSITVLAMPSFGAIARLRSRSSASSIKRWRTVRPPFVWRHRGPRAIIARLFSSKVAESGLQPLRSTRSCWRSARCLRRPQLRQGEDCL